MRDCILLWGDVLKQLREEEAGSDCGDSSSLVPVHAHGLEVAHADLDGVLYHALARVGVPSPNVAERDSSGGRVPHRVADVRLVRWDDDGEWLDAVAHSVLAGGEGGDLGGVRTRDGS